MTFLAALRHDRIDAPWVVDGPINGELFRLYVEKVLVPALKPDDIVVLDNLGSHKSQAVRAAIRAAGALLPSALQPRSEPDRASLRQAEASAAQSRRTYPRGHLEAHRIPARQVPSHRMRKLSHQLRIRFRLQSSRSNTNSL
jgi:hypothetical protein